ncbi:MAG: hypothetical protein WCT06_02170 [Armatimonadota bacterium]
MKSVKRIAVAALTFCAVSAMGVAAQAASAGPADAGIALKPRPGMAANKNAGARHMRERGRMHKPNSRDALRFKQEKRMGVRVLKRAPTYQFKIVVAPGQNKKQECINCKDYKRCDMRMHKAGYGFMANLNLTPNQKVRIKSIKRAAKADIEAVKCNTSLTRDAKISRIMSIRRSTRARIHSVLTPNQQRQLDAARAKYQKDTQSHCPNFGRG